MQRNFKIRQDGLYLQLLFYELAKFDGMRLKIEGALNLCDVAVVAKTCLENSVLKYATCHTILLPVKTLIRHISQTIRRIEKHFSLLEVHLMYIYFLRKSQFRNFEPLQRER